MLKYGMSAADPACAAWPKGANCCFKPRAVVKMGAFRAGYAKVFDSKFCKLGVWGCALYPLNLDLKFERWAI